MGERLTELLSTSLLLLLLVCHLGGVFSIVNFEVSGFGLAGRCVDVLVTRTAWGGRLVVATIGRTANRNTQKYRNTEIQKYSKVVYHIYNVVIVRFQIYLGKGENDMLENERGERGRKEGE